LPHKPAPDLNMAQAQQQPAKQQPPAAWKGFAQGAIGAMVGASASHPLDLIKVRMQIEGEAAASAGAAAGPRVGMVGLGRSIFQESGVPGLFRGLTASLFRQFFYSGGRFGVYDMLKSAAGVQDGSGASPSLVQLVGMAATAGAVGACVANPGDVAMVRMQADGKLPPSERRNYKHIGDALRRVAAEEGVGRLWRGVVPTVNRAMIVTVGHLAAYDEAKNQFKSRGILQEGIPLHFAASFTAAFVASLLSHPVDVVRVC
jgi:solute carrier family 25 oxoglutarate transporter 11